MLGFVSYLPLIIIAKCSLAAEFEITKAEACQLLCGPHSLCNLKNINPCTCMPGYGFNETSSTCTILHCVNNSDCGLGLACVNQKCINPCNGTCGIHEICRVQNYENYAPMCSCLPGFTRNQFKQCTKKRSIAKSFCKPNPCGLNTICLERRVAGVCFCRDGYAGDPYINCKPECKDNSECPSQLSCINKKCLNPCLNSCGRNASCDVKNHQPVCYCEQGLVGDPFVSCYPEKKVPEHINRGIEDGIDGELLSSSTSKVPEHINRGIEDGMDGELLSSSTSKVPEHINKGIEHDVDGELSSSPSKSSRIEPIRNLWIIGCSIALCVILIISAVAAVCVWRIMDRRARAKANNHIYEEVNYSVTFASASESEAEPRPAYPLPKGAETQEYVYDIVYETRVQRLWEARRFAHERSERKKEIRRLAASMPRV